MIDGFKELTYDERLRQTNLISLETRRLRGGLIEVFKIFKGLIDILPKELLILEKDKCTNKTFTTRGHEYKIYKQHARLDLRKYFFSQWVIEVWNNLPHKAVKVVNVNAFKSHIEPIMKNRRELTIGPKGLPAQVRASDWLADEGIRC